MYKKRNASGAKGQIQGRVTDSHFINPLQGITVVVFGKDADNINYIKDVETDINGIYIITDLYPDTYYIIFKDKSGKYLNKEYGKQIKTIMRYEEPSSHNELNLKWPEEQRKMIQQMVDRMDKVVVTDKNTTTLLDTYLSLSGSIKGKVTLKDGVTPLKNIEVIPCYLDNYYYMDNYYYGHHSCYDRHSIIKTTYRSVNTNTDGMYFINGLESGAYRVKFHDRAGYYANNYYNNNISPHLADNIHVVAGFTVIEIDASLHLAAHIKGRITDIDRITPLRNIEVQLIVDTYYGSHVFSHYIIVHTDFNGYYDIGGLSAGTYQGIKFHDALGRYIDKKLSNTIDIKPEEIIIIDSCLEKKLRKTSRRSKEE